MYCPWCQTEVNQFEPRVTDFPDVYHQRCHEKMEERLGIRDWFADFKLNWSNWLENHPNTLEA